MAATVRRLDFDRNNGMNAPQLLLATARNLQTYRPEYKSSDVEAVAPVIALLTNRLLVSAHWSVSYSATYTTHSSPIRWRLFGSGPRLAWEWAAVIIFAGLLIAVLASVVLSWCYRFMPGPWLELGGMLIAGNRSPPIASLAQTSKAKLDEVRLHLHVGDNDGERAKLSDRPPPLGLELDPSKEYLYCA
ncbi:hypothetical protein Tdes44962_MAKER02652 [Teratosphaeria destructans]|uniref:Uncharacterized protein n=1 Tax=Teratosphaeria destructans TaxID=418781 RepID=A0A9W7SSM4_9PEZI|nr:hypothetical protein Tdes44962_MAKER02652 [Teratosphaeria destructans]